MDEVAAAIAEHEAKQRAVDEAQRRKQAVETAALQAVLDREQRSDMEAQRAHSKEDNWSVAPSEEGQSVDWCCLRCSTRNNDAASKCKNCQTPLGPSLSDALADVEEQKTSLKKKLAATSRRLSDKNKRKLQQKIADAETLIREKWPNGAQSSRDAHTHSTAAGPKPPSKNKSLPGKAAATKMAADEHAEEIIVGMLKGFKAKSSGMNMCGTAFAWPSAAV